MHLSPPIFGIKNSALHLWKVVGCSGIYIFEKFQIFMDKRAPQNGWFFIRFVTFTITLVVVVSELRSAGPFYIVGWWGFNPWRVLIGVNFSIVGWWGSNPWRVPVLYIFYNYQNPNARMLPDTYVWYNLTITIALHIHFLVSQLWLKKKTRDSPPKGYDLRPFLMIWTR